MASIRSSFSTYEVLEASRHAGETIVLVGHTVINRAILLGMLGRDLNRFWRLRQDTCARQASPAGLARRAGGGYHRPR